MVAACWDWSGCRKFQGIKVFLCPVSVMKLVSIFSRFILLFFFSKKSWWIPRGLGLGFRIFSRYSLLHLFRKLQTSLGCGKDPGQEESSPASHLLDFDESCVLLECPIDLSALALFHPAPLPEEQSVSVRSFIAVRKRKGNQDALLRPSARIRLNHEEDGKGRDCKEMSSLFKELNGQVLAKGEPWYKVSGMELVDVGLLDAVIISNPAGMLGLPFLTKHPDFCGKARIFSHSLLIVCGFISLERR